MFSTIRFRLKYIPWKKSALKYLQGKLHLFQSKSSNTVFVGHQSCSGQIQLQIYFLVELEDTNSCPEMFEEYEYNLLEIFGKSI